MVKLPQTPKQWEEEDENEVYENPPCPSFSAFYQQMFGPSPLGFPSPFLPAAEDNAEEKPFSSIAATNQESMNSINTTEKIDKEAATGCESEQVKEDAATEDNKLKLNAAAEETSTHEKKKMKRK